MGYEGFEDYEKNFLLAAQYYESVGDFVNAVKYYKKAGKEDKIREILIQNAKLHPGIGNIFLLKKYYMEIPEDEVKQSPLLMSALSIMYSIMLIPEESEKWADDNPCS